MPGAPTADSVLAVEGGAYRSHEWLATSTSRFGMVVFLASDVMLFAAFFSAYYVLRGANGPWPPEGVELDVVRALMATIVLVSSSFTLVAADRALAAERAQVARRWVLVTVALGAAFAVNQVLEYLDLTFGIDDHPYGSAYWMLTGLHGAHVLAGLAALLLLFVRLVRGRDLARVEPYAGGVSLYWHMVDAVWVAVFLTIWVVR
ncbi:MAG TPA: cytochrome c oxidase subunit 3 [Ilumatobacter sp.]|nr:cytochrome c oxidase subunit 3 [Ilumatobacter sp.]